MPRPLLRRATRRPRRSNPWRTLPTLSEPESGPEDAQTRVRSSSGKVLVVGLGKSGMEYQFTPHNAGFLAIDRIAGNYGAVVGNRRCRALDGERQDRE